MKAAPSVTVDMMHRAVRQNFLPTTFCQERIFDASDHEQGVGYSFTTELHALVVEPLCFGYRCHSGPGLFVPAER
jgi:hypothetical protein